MNPRSSQLDDKIFCQKDDNTERVPLIDTICKETGGVGYTSVEVVTDSCVYCDFIIIIIPEEHERTSRRTD